MTGVVSSIDPPPDAEEVAAIVAALTAVQTAAGGAPQADPAPRWRFAGRWWTKPIPLRRNRPW